MVLAFLARPVTQPQAWLQGGVPGDVSRATKRNFSLFSQGAFEQLYPDLSPRSWEA